MAMPMDGGFRQQVSLSVFPKGPADFVRIVSSVRPCCDNPNFRTPPGQHVLLPLASLLSYRRNGRRRGGVGHVDIGGNGANRARADGARGANTDSANGDTDGDANRRHLARSSLLGAVTGDVTSLAALVACLAGRVEGTTIGCGAIPGDVAELTAGVALHGLGLTVASEVVGATALVASSSTRTGKATTAEAGATVATAHNRAATAHRGHTRDPGHASHAGDTGHTGHTGNGDTRGSRASAGQVSRLATVIATTAGTGTRQAQGGAISLHMAETLAVVALLGLGSAWQRALVGLVAFTYV